jgi:glutathione S-transferase
MRLYGHNSCYYSEKVRLVMAAKKLQYQNIEIGTYENPQWLIDINGGNLPILELPNGECLYESKLIMDYLQ